MRRLLASLVLLISGNAFAFVDLIAVQPTAPRADQDITVSFRAGECDGVRVPLRWTLAGQGRARALIVDGVYSANVCDIPVGRTDVMIGRLPPGAYRIDVRLVDPLDGIGIPSASFGSVQFVVSAAAPDRPIPSLLPAGAVILILALIWAARSR